MTRYTIELEPLPDQPGKDRIEPILRLRKALKVLLRSFRLRCVNIYETPNVPRPREQKSPADLTSKEVSNHA